VQLLLLLLDVEEHAAGEHAGQREEKQDVPTIKSTIP